MRVQQSVRSARLSHGMSTKPQRSASVDGNAVSPANSSTCRRRSLASRSGVTTCARERPCSRRDGVRETGIAATAASGGGAATATIAATLKPSLLRLAMDALSRLRKDQCGAPQPRQPHRPRWNGERYCHRVRQFCGDDRGGLHTRDKRFSDKVEASPKGEGPCTAKMAHSGRLWDAHPYFSPTGGSDDVAAPQFASSSTFLASQKSFTALFGAKSVNAHPSLESSFSTFHHADIADPKVPRQVLRESLPSTIREEPLVSMLLDACSDEHGSVALGDMLPFLASAEEGDAEGVGGLNVLCVTSSASFTKAYFRVFLLLEARQYQVDEKMRIKTKSPDAASLTADSPWLLFAEQLFHHLPRFPRHLLYSTGPLGEERTPPKEYGEYWDSWSTSPPAIQFLPLLQVWPVIMFPRFVVLMTRWGKRPMDVLRELQLTRSSSPSTSLFSSRPPTALGSLFADISHGCFANSHPYYDEDAGASGKQANISLNRESSSVAIPAPQLKVSGSVKRINSLLNVWQSESGESATLSCSSQFRRHSESSPSRSRQLNESLTLKCAFPTDVFATVHPPTKLTSEVKLRQKTAKNLGKAHVVVPSNNKGSCYHVAPGRCTTSTTTTSTTTTTNISGCSANNAAESGGRVAATGTLLDTKDNGVKGVVCHRSLQGSGGCFASRIHSAVESGRELHEPPLERMQTETQRGDAESTHPLSGSCYSFSPFPSFPVLPTATQLPDLACSLLQQSYAEHDVGPWSLPSPLPPALPLPMPLTPPPPFSLSSSPMKSTSGVFSELQEGSKVMKSMSRGTTMISSGALEEEQMCEVLQDISRYPSCTNISIWTRSTQDFAGSLRTEIPRGLAMLAPDKKSDSEFDLSNTCTDAPTVTRATPGPARPTRRVLTNEAIERNGNVDPLCCWRPIPPPLTQFEGKNQRTWFGAALLLQLAGRGYLARGYLARGRAAGVRRNAAATILRRLFAGFAARHRLCIRQALSKGTGAPCTGNLVVPSPPSPTLKGGIGTPCMRFIRGGKLAVMELSVAPMGVSDDDDDDEIGRLASQQQASTPEGGDDKKGELEEQKRRPATLGILQRVGRAYMSRPLCQVYLENRLTQGMSVEMLPTTSSTKTPVEETETVVAGRPLDGRLSVLPPMDGVSFMQETNTASSTSSASRRRSPGVTFIAYGQDGFRAEANDWFGSLSQSPDVRRESPQNAWHMRIKRHVDFQRQYPCQQQQQQQEQEQQQMLLLLRETFEEEENVMEHLVVKRPKTPVGFPNPDEGNSNPYEAGSAPPLPTEQESVTPPEAFLLEDKAAATEEGATGLPPLPNATGCLAPCPHAEENFLSEAVSSVCNSCSFSSAVPTCCFFSSSTRSALSAAWSATPNTAVLRELDIAFPFENASPNEGDDGDDDDDGRACSESPCSSLSSDSEAFEGDGNEGILTDFVVPAGLTDHAIINEADATFLIQRLGRGFAARKHLHFSLLLAVSWFEISVLHRAAAGHYHRKQMGYRYHATMEAQRELQRFYYRNQCAVHIQRVFRGFLARQRTKKLQRKMWVRIELYVALEQQELYEEG